MDNKLKKRYFLNHKKPSVQVVNVVIHAALLIVAFLYVAVHMVIRPEQRFEA